MKKLSIAKMEALSAEIELNDKQKIQIKGGNGGRKGTITVLDTDMESIVKG